MSKANDAGVSKNPDDSSDATNADRGRGRRWAWLLASAIAVVIVGLLGLSSGAIDVDRIEFGGLHRTSLDDATEAVGISIGDALVFVDTREAEASLRTLPWVDDARVRKRWPGTVEVEISERVGLALALSAPGRWALVDAHGRVLTRALVSPPPLPRLSGIRAAPAPGAFLGADAEAMLAVVHALASQPALELKAVWRNGRNDLRARLHRQASVGELEIVLGDDSALAAKAAAIAAVVGTSNDAELLFDDAREITGDVSEGIELDVSVPHLPVLRSPSVVDARSS